MKREILFQDSSATTIPTNAPRATPQSWADHTLKVPFRKAVIRWPEGQTATRLIPALPGAARPTYVETVDIVKLGEVTAPTQKGDLFSRALSWFYNNQKDSLFHSEKNPNGFTLKPKTQGIAWAITWDEEKKPHVGLIKSAFSGGKNPGLLGMIVAAAQATELDPETNVESKVYEHSIVDKTHGRNVTVSKIVDPAIKEKQFATSYAVAIGSKATPLPPIIDKLPDEEFELLSSPLDQVINYLSEDEQRSILRDYLGADLLAKMGI